MSDIESRIVDEHRSFITDTTVIESTQRFSSGGKVVGWLMVPNEMVADAAAYRAALDHHYDRVFRPWLWPDRNPFPVIDLFPRWTRFVAWLDRVRPRRREIWDDDWD